MKAVTAWRKRIWVWATPLAVVLANLLVLLLHPGRTGAGFAEMERLVESERGVLDELTEKERALEAVLRDARANREGLGEIYRVRFATEQERLTALITEVKELARRAGLAPASISYPEETLDQFGLVRMSLVFGVQGSYAQLRALVNLIEVSDYFLVLERVSLNDASGSELNIKLQISTFFVREPDDQQSSNRAATVARESSERVGESAAPRRPTS